VTEARNIGIGIGIDGYCHSNIGHRSLISNRSFSSRNALVILEGKIKGKKAKGGPKRMWFDDIRQWTMLKDYGEVKRSAEDCVAWRAITRQPST